MYCCVFGFVAYGADEGCNVLNHVIKFVTRVVLFNAPLWHTHARVSSKDPKNNLKKSNYVATTGRRTKNDSYCATSASVKPDSSPARETSVVFVCSLDEHADGRESNADAVCCGDTANVHRA